MSHVPYTPPKRLEYPSVTEMRQLIADWNAFVVPSEAAIQQQVDDAVARFQAEWDASRADAPPSPDEEMRAQLNAARFKEVIADAAIAAGVRPSSVRHVVRDAAEVFELKDGGVAPRHGEMDPGDPLQPLAPLRWLEQLRATDPYLFIR